MAVSFNSEMPFPLMGEKEITYREAQLHAAKVDAWLGFQIDQIEEKIRPLPQHQIWSGLGAQKFLTPYIEIRWMLELLQPASGETIIDLGAGYGRMAFVLKHHFPKVWFLGYELSPQRADEATRLIARWGCEHARMKVANLSAQDFKPSSAAYYFIYDYGFRHEIDKTLTDLLQIARSRSIIVVGRGRSVRDAVEHEHPWLAQVIEPRHFQHFSIYQSAGQTAD